LALEAAGAEIHEVSHSAASETPSHISITSILQTLRNYGVNSLMVEGGAKIIGSFLSEGTVDALIITIAPVFVGEAGVGYHYPTMVSESGELVARFKEAHTELVGRDSLVSLVPV
jgi:2,5-diamino-6-(ribosylamino)-4(3H)-pyrimidinone 5'-phosphate reductase